MANYQWRASLNFESGDPGQLSHGVTPSTQETWQTAAAGGSMTPGQYTYWYRDSNTMWSGAYQDTLSSRVALKVTQTWTTSVDNMNVLSVTVTTTVDSIDRDDIRAPSGYSDSNTPGRDIKLYKNDGTLVFSTVDTQVATAHNLSGSLSLGSETFTINPGDTTVVKPSLYLHNQTVGGSSYDDIWLGIQFRNPLPSPVLYTLNYNANGGSGAPSAQTAYSTTGSASFTVPNTSPTWGQYEFLGWSFTQYPDSRTEADVEYRAGDTVTLTSDNPTRTLYAVWRKDYRPGCVYDNSVWQSHNRPNGECHVYNGSKYLEMRTIGAPTAMGNPPSVYHNNKLYNMARIGLNGA